VNRQQLSQYPVHFVRGMVLGEITPNHFIWDTESKNYRSIALDFDIVLNQEQYDEVFPLPKDIDISPNFDIEARCIKQKKTIEMFNECYKNGSEPISWLKFLFGIDIYINHPTLESYEIWKQFHEERIKAKQTKLPRRFVRSVLCGEINYTHFTKEDYITKSCTFISQDLIRIYGQITITEGEFNILFPEDPNRNKFSNIYAFTENHRMGIGVLRIADVLVRMADFANIDVTTVLRCLTQFNHEFPNATLLPAECVNVAIEQYQQHKESIEKNFNIIEAVDMGGTDHDS